MKRIEVNNVISRFLDVHSILELRISPSLFSLLAMNCEPRNQNRNYYCSLFFNPISLAHSEYAFPIKP